MYLFVSLWSSSSYAIEIPFSQLFLGARHPSLIEDGEIYPPSYVSLESEYWDIYHEQRSDKLHDYDQNIQRLRAVVQSGIYLAGFEIGRSSLRIKQDNVYTDADRMRGQAEITGGRVLLGTSRIERDLFIGISEIQFIGRLGYQKGFAGDIETLFGWGNRVELHLRAETFRGDVDISEDINGIRIPVFFPLRTDRVYGRLEGIASNSFRIRVVGSFENTQGEGEVRQGFENKPRFQQYRVGGWLDYHLERFDRFQNVPRLSRSGGWMPGIRLSALYRAGNGDLDMYFKNIRYLRLDGLRTLDSTIRLDIVPFRPLSLFGGWQRMRVQHDGNSFFDVWPFVVWDVFTAKRYRLGEMDAKLDAWFVGLGVLAEWDLIEIDITGRFEWWNDYGAVDLLERVDVLFPFFFTYEKTENDLDVPLRYAIQINPSALLRVTPRLGLRFSGRIAVPFGKEPGETAPPDPGGEPPPPALPEDGSTHGGILGRIELIVSL